MEVNITVWQHINLDFLMKKVRLYRSYNESKILPKFETFGFHILSPHLLLQLLIEIEAKCYKAGERDV